MEAIISGTHRYFDYSDFDKLEETNLLKLLKTVLRFQAFAKNIGQQRIIVARNDVENWWHEQNVLDLKKLTDTLAVIEKESGFKLHHPNKITEIGSLKYAVIGIEGIDLFSDDFINFAISATWLLDLDISFFTFVFVTNGKTNFGTRVSKEYFQKLLDAMDGKPVEVGGTGFPIPVIPDKELLQSLDGISLNIISTRKSDESFYKMMFDVWKLSEYKERLSRSNDIENRWLIQTEEEFTATINQYLLELDLEDTLNFQVKEIIAKVLAESAHLSTQEILDLLYERAIKTAKLIAADS